MQITLKKINYKNKLMTALGTSLFVVAATVIFVFKPSFSAVLEMSKNIESQYTELKNKFKDTKNTKELLKDINESEEKSGYLNKFFLRPGQELSLITKLEEVSAKNGLNQSMSLNPVSTKKQGVVKSPLSLNVNGKYEDVLAYLADLQTMDVYINISAINLSRTGDMNADANISAEVQYIIVK